MDCFLFFMTCKNGKNRNQWKIISNQFLFMKSNLHCFSLGRWRVQSSFHEITFQNKERCIEKVSRTCKIILSCKTRKNEKKHHGLISEKKDISESNNRQWKMIDSCVNQSCTCRLFFNICNRIRIVPF